MLLPILAPLPAPLKTRYSGIASAISAIFFPVCFSSDAAITARRSLAVIVTGVAEFDQALRLRRTASRLRGLTNPATPVKWLPCLQCRNPPIEPLPRMIPCPGAATACADQVVRRNRRAVAMRQVV
jgi:hypothetical protein